MLTNSLQRCMLYSSGSGSNRNSNNDMAWHVEWKVGKQQVGIQR